MKIQFFNVKDVISLANDNQVLKLENLSMSFGSNEVLKGINLEVNKGQIIGYIGPNWAGKSTTLKIMLGLLDGYECDVTIFGNKISAEDHNYKRHIGYVPENAELYDNLTAAEYLTFVGELYGMDRDAAEKKALELLTLFDMDDVFHNRISSFSKGMRQKVLITSCLLHNPDLIFLDEPLSGLDANSVMMIKDILETLVAQGKTIFYSSHIMEVVEKISSIIVLLIDGKIAADGSFEELKSQSQQGSLEGIFNQLTGYEERKDTASKFVNIVTDESGDENE